MTDEGMALLDKEHFTREGHKQIVTGVQWVKIKGSYLNPQSTVINFKGQDRDIRCVHQGNGTYSIFK